MTNNTPRPLGVLDEFKSAGIFVNWWQQIRYDLKTIISIGWRHTLIPDAYLIAAFFQAQADAIEALEPKISEIQSELAEAVCSRVLVPKPNAPVATEQSPKTTAHPETGQKHPEAALRIVHRQRSKARQTPP